MGLIVCLGSRDAFLKHYARYLSGRLLNATSINNEAEKQLLEKLRLEWGHVAVMKINSMLHDIDTSKDINQQFQSYLVNTKTSFSVQVMIQVLTQGCWPESEISKMRIPQTMQPIKDVFETFYRSKYQGKVLNWLMSLGDAELNANYDKKYSVVVSNYQFAILDLFNKKNSYSFEELKTQLEMNEHDLSAHLIIMCTKVPLLSKEIKTNKVKNSLFKIFLTLHQEAFTDQEIISINTTFSSQTKRIVCKPLKSQAAKVASTFKS